MAEQLKATPHKELYCVIGFVRDKDLAHILPLLPRDAHYIFTQAQTERALPAAELTAKAAIYGSGGNHPEVPAAVAHARELAAADDMSSSAAAPMSSPKRSDTYDIQNPYKVRPSVSDGLSFAILNKTIKNSFM